jgi:hypothetical protein
MLVVQHLITFNVDEWPLDNIKWYGMSSNVTLNVEECYSNVSKCGRMLDFQHLITFNVIKPAFLNIR